MQNNVQILSTKIIGESLVSTASSYNIFIDQLAFIKTEELITRNIKERISALSLQSVFVVFTSINALNAVSKLLTTKPFWKIFCIDQKTKKLAENIFGAENMMGSAGNAAQLAEKIIKDSSIEKIVFFSGNQRKNNLPEKIKLQGIDLEELVVYNTIETPQIISKAYDGILFFSPSAVKSFFSVNNITDTTQLFAIGNSTANEVKNFSDIPVIISEYPVVENLVCQAIKHFSKIKTS